MTPAKILIVMATIAASSPALAQGSTGGTIGQHNKSSSGTISNEDRSAPPQQRQSAPAKNPSEASCKLAAVWQNQVAGFGNSVWTITADGTAVEQGLGAARGHASLSGHTLTIIYTTIIDTGKYVMHLSQDCSGASGQVTITSGIRSGVSGAATFSR